MLLTHAAVVVVEVFRGDSRNRSGRLAAMLSVALTWAAFCQPALALENWLTSYDEAMAKAQQSGRPVLTVFTGSDWCPHSKTLENNVLDTDLFRAWAEPNVVLLMIDLPQEGISQAVRSERSQVCLKYGVRTFPSVLLIGPDGSKIALQAGYTGQSAENWVTGFAQKLPARPAIKQVLSKTSENSEKSGSQASTGTPGADVHASLDRAVETARGVKRPILLVVARPGDNKAKSHSESLINDPEFESFARENFVVAQVAPAAASDTQTGQSIENLLGGAELPPESVEIIVTDDGQTPLFSQSGTQPPARIVSGLRRFLAARQSAKFR